MDTRAEWLSVVGAVLGSAGSVGATPVSTHYHTPVAPSPVLTTENVSGRGHGYRQHRRVRPGDVSRRYREGPHLLRLGGWAGPQFHMPFSVTTTESPIRHRDS